MSELIRTLFVEKIDALGCVRLEPVPGLDSRGAQDTSLLAAVIETRETPPSTGFWGTLAACGRFELILRRVG
jgi:hypothetical protein